MRIGSFSFECVQQSAIDPLSFCDHLFVIPSGVEESLSISETSRDVSTSLDMTEVFSRHANMERITIRVPASTSNLGPGFDCLGVALRMYNVIQVERAAERNALPPILDEAAKLFFKRSRTRSFPLSCSIIEQVPRSRGLGSSATVRVGL